jgi:hypothetical protein
MLFKRITYNNVIEMQTKRRLRGNAKLASFGVVKLKIVVNNANLVELNSVILVRNIFVKRFVGILKWWTYKNIDIF